MRMYFFLVILGAVVMEVIADILFKAWSINDRTALLWTGVGLYAAGTVVWAYSLKFEFLTKAISVFTVLNLIAVILIGVLYFKESLSPLNKVGIVLGILSVILVQL